MNSATSNKDCAPEISNADFITYTGLAADAEPPVRDAMISLIESVQQYHEVAQTTVPHIGILNGYGELFDNLTGDTRNAAFHLLWYAKELSLGREPVTK